MIADVVLEQEITVPGIDIELLRKQRSLVLTTIEILDHVAKKEEIHELEGIVNLLDSMLDTAEGYPEPIQKNREVKKEKVE